MREIQVPELSALGKEARVAHQLVDVRSPSEFATGHVPGATNIPLEEIEQRQDDLSQEQPVVLICKSGTRAGIAAEFLSGKRGNLTVLRGGTEAWAKAGLPLVVSAKTRWSLERQVRLAAGLLVLTGVVLSLTLYAPMVYLAGLVGLGLAGAGLTDFCPMGILLAKMPWNKAKAVAPVSCTLKARN